MNRAIKDHLHDTQGAVVKKLHSNMRFRNISIRGVPKMSIQAGGRKTDATKKFNCLLQFAANHACVLIARVKFKLLQPLPFIFGEYEIIIVFVIFIEERKERSRTPIS
jgi:hypothetical protein